MSKIRIDLALSLGSQLAFKLIGFGIVAIVARYLSQDDFGRLSLALSICTLGALFTDLGYSTDSVRKIAAKPESTLERLGLVISLRLPLILVFLVVINLAMWISKPDLLLITLGISLSAAAKDLYRSFSSVFIARRRNTRNIITFGVSMSLVLAGVSASSYFDWGMPGIIGFYIVGGVSMVVIAAAQVFKLYGPVTLQLSSQRLKGHLFSGIVLFALTALTYAHFAVDNIILGNLIPYEEVALYAAASHLLEASQFAIRPLTLIMFPICTLLCANACWAAMGRMLFKLYGGAVVLGLFALVVIFAIADQVVLLAYSSKFDASADLLRVLYISVPGLFLTSVAVFVSAALNREKQACLALASGLIVKVLLSPWIVDQMGPVGMAWLTCMSQTLIACWLVVDTGYIVWRNRAMVDEPVASQSG